MLRQREQCIIKYNAEISSTNEIHKTAQSFMLEARKMVRVIN